MIKPKIWGEEKLREKNNLGTIINDHHPLSAGPLLTFSSFSLVRHRSSSSDPSCRLRLRLRLLLRILSTQHTTPIIDSNPTSGGKKKGRTQGKEEGRRRKKTLIPNLSRPTMADQDLSPDGLAGFDFDPTGMRYPYTSRVSWPIAIPADPNASRSAPLHQNANTKPSNIMKRSTTPLQSLTQAYDQPISQSQSYIPDWRLHQQSPAQQFAYPLDTYPQQFAPDPIYTMPYQTSPTDYVPQVQYDSNTYFPLAGAMDGSIPFDWQDLSNDLVNYPLSNGLPDMNLPHPNLPTSPTDTSLEVRSLSSSDNGWNSVEYHQQTLGGSFQDPHTGNIFNPEQTLHGRTFSDSSYSDVERQSRQSWGSYINLPQHAIGSPSSDHSTSLSDMDFHHARTDFLAGSPPIKQEQEQHTRSTIVTSAVAQPIRIKTSSSPQRSPTSTGRVSPPGKRQAVKKNSNSKATKPTIRRQPQAPKVDTEKRVGRRKGPLRPEQRKQASEIRKLGACIRCKFLKKTVSGPKLPNIRSD